MSDNKQTMPLEVEKQGVEDKRSRKRIINQFVRYKNIAISNIGDAIQTFWFSLYYWFGLRHGTRYHLKNVSGVRIALKAYFVKERVIVDIHLREKT